MNTSQLRALFASNATYLAKTGGGTISGINEVHLLAEGAIAVFTENNLLIAATATADDLVPHTHFWFAVGNPAANGGVYRSPLIPRDSVSVSHIDNETPVYQVVSVGLVGGTGTLNLPATYQDNTYASLIITKLEPAGSNGRTTRRYEVQVYSTDTDQDVVDRLVAAISADPAAFVTAASVGTDEGIDITATEYGPLIYVGADGIIQNATIHAAGSGNSVDGFEGAGTPTQIAELLANNDILEGDAFRTHNVANGGGNGWWTRAGASLSSTYEVYTWTWDQQGRAGIRLVDLGMRQFSLVVDADSTYTGLVAVLDALKVLPASSSGAAADTDSGVDGSLT